MLLVLLILFVDLDSIHSIQCNYFNIVINKYSIQIAHSCKRYLLKILITNLHTIISWKYFSDLLAIGINYIINNFISLLICARCINEKIKFSWQLFKKVFNTFSNIHLLNTVVNNTNFIIYNRFRMVNLVFIWDRIMAFRFSIMFECLILTWRFSYWILFCPLIKFSSILI